MGAWLEVCCNVGVEVVTTCDNDQVVVNVMHELVEVVNKVDSRTMSTSRTSIRHSLTFTTVKARIGAQIATIRHIITPRFGRTQAAYPFTPGAGDRARIDVVENLGPDIVVDEAQGLEKVQYGVHGFDAQNGSQEIDSMILSRKARFTGQRMVMRINLQSFVSFPVAAQPLIVSGCDVINDFHLSHQKRRGGLVFQPFQILTNPRSIPPQPRNNGLPLPLSLPCKTRLRRAPLALHPSLPSFPSRRPPPLPQHPPPPPPPLLHPLPAPLQAPRSQ